MEGTHRQSAGMSLDRENRGKENPVRVSFGKKNRGKASLDRESLGRRSSPAEVSNPARVSSPARAGRPRKTTRRIRQNQRVTLASILLSRKAPLELRVCLEPSDHRIRNNS